MTPRRRVWPALALLGGLLPACDGIFIFRPPGPLPPCDTDSDCQGPAICFPDGCGDPGVDIKVQVSHGGTAQELEISKLQATFDPQLRRHSTVSGTVSQATSSGTVPYTGKVTFSAVGSALLIPGVPRRAEGLLQPSAGQFSLPISSGLYSSIVAAGADPTIPPVMVGDGETLTVRPGDQPQVGITFPPVSALLRISGVLLRTAASGPLQAPMVILALHPTSRRPITSPQPVDASTGSFTLLVPPQAAAGGAPVLLLARPQSGAGIASAIVPQHSFAVAAPAASLVLEMGEFGETVTVTGVVLDANGQPVGGATVFIEGSAEGGGTFKGVPAPTAAGTGAFTLHSLPSPAGGTLDLWVLPPAGSSAGRLKAQVVVPPQGGFLGALRCPWRVMVAGRVIRPDGMANASGVAVRAEPLAGVDGGPPPSFSPQAVTDGEGSFSFRADPGEYRLDFVPADTLPRVSRRVTVASVPQENGEPLPVEVPAFTLWYGRTLTGTVTGFATPAATAPTPLDGASVELWRVVWENGKLVSYSLGQGQADASGRYSVVLPTVPPSLQPDGG